MRKRSAVSAAQLELQFVFEEAGGFSFGVDLAPGRLLSCFVSRKALVGRAVKDGVWVFESEQVAEFFTWYRAEIEAVARAKHAAGKRCVGEHDVLVLDRDLNGPAL